MFFFKNVMNKPATHKNFFSEQFFIFKPNLFLLKNHKILNKIKAKNYYSSISCNKNGSISDDNLKPHWLNLNEKKKYKLDKDGINKENENENNRYLSISKKSKFMKYIIRLRKKKNFRKKMNEFFVKDSKTILYLSNNKNIFFEALLSGDKNLLHYFRNKCKKLYYVNSDILNYIFYDSLNIKADKNDAVAILKIPSEIKKVETIKFLLAFDRIRYAYNLGKILNVAYSMDVDCLFYFDNTVDPFNSKVIEITNGSHLYVPYIYGSHQELKDLCRDHNLIPIVAHVNGVSPNNILKESNKNGICLILSNESTGPHSEILKFAKPISLPMHEMTNSLNVSVAASILIHYLKTML